MPFEPKNKTMTSKDQIAIKKEVTVVSSPSGNEITGLPGNEVNFEEVGHPINFDAVTEPEVPASAQAVPGVNPADYVGFEQPQTHINRMNPRDLDNFMRESVVARPVRLPSKLNARSKDPNWRLRWIEFKAEDGRRFNDAHEMGFQLATKDDVVGIQVKIRADGWIVSDDLVLMKIPCEIIDGYYKHNALSALKMVSQQGSRQLAKREGDAVLREGIASEGFNPNSQQMKDAFGRNKVELYVPGVK